MDTIPPVELEPVYTVPGQQFLTFEREIAEMDEERRRRARAARLETAGFRRTRKAVR